MDILDILLKPLQPLMGLFLMCVQLYKQNRYRDTEIKGYFKGVKSSSIYTMSKMSKMQKMGKEHTHSFLLITFLIFNQIFNPGNI